MPVPVSASPPSWRNSISTFGVSTIRLRTVKALRSLDRGREPAHGRPRALQAAAGAFYSFDARADSQRVAFTAWPKPSAPPKSWPRPPPAAMALDRFSYVPFSVSTMPFMITKGCMRGLLNR